MATGLMSRAIPEPEKTPDFYAEDAKRDDSVSSIANRIASKDSALMRSAATKGKQYANRRGLLNSSIGAQATQQAVLDAAVPMAAQEANQSFQKNLTDQQTDAQKDVNEQQFGFNRDLQGDRIKADRQQQADSFTFQRDENALNRQFEQWKQNTNLDATSQQQAGSMVNHYAGLYQNTLANINSNPNLSATARADQIASAGALYNRQVALVEDLYSINLQWNDQGSSYTYGR